MKITTIIVCLVSVFTTNSYLFGLAKADSAVLDTDGDEVQTGINYYVMPAISGPTSGGLTLASTAEKLCPEIVVQNWSEKEYGMPVNFSKVNSDVDDKVVSLNGDIYVEFLPDYICTTSTVWTIENSKLTTGGVKGEVVSGRSPSWFRIDKYQGQGPKFGYRFIYCPHSKSTPLVCDNIGRIYEDRRRRFGVTEDVAFQWIFIKATNIDKLVA